MSNTYLSVLKTYLGMLNILSGLYLGIYSIHTYLYACNNNEKRGHEFQRDQGRVYYRFWRKEGQNDSPNLISNK